MPKLYINVFFVFLLVHSPYPEINRNSRQFVFQYRGAKVGLKPVGRRHSNHTLIGIPMGVYFSRFN